MDIQRKKSKIFVQLKTIKLSNIKIKINIQIRIILPLIEIKPYFDNSKLYFIQIHDYIV